VIDNILYVFDMPDFSEPDLVLATKRIPQGVICLISALSYYELTTQIPHFVYIALPRTSRLPQADYPPLRCFWYSKSAYKAGVEKILQPIIETIVSQ
jgi:predicted transcriptional regulator of viral defense system